MNINTRYNSVHFGTLYACDNFVVEMAALHERQVICMSRSSQSSAA